MANEESNIAKYQKSLTPEQRKENAQRAAKFPRPRARLNADIRKIAKQINKAQAPAELQAALRKLGLEDVENLSNAAGIAIATYQAAIEGDIRAAEKWEKYVGQAEDQLAAKEKKKEEKADPLAGRPFHLPAETIASCFVDVYRDILARKHTEYMLKGGRGTTKSSFAALAIIPQIINNKGMNAAVLRKVGNTLRTSVYNTVLWAIDLLGLNDLFTTKVSPMEVIYKPTGQGIYFFGLDDPLKLKSAKPKTGYFGLLWLEELDQFAGPEEIRSIKQSVIRGGEEAITLLTYNPPRSINNWVNLEADRPKDSRLVSHTTYLQVPPEWLGPGFLAEAEDLKATNEAAYEHEYLGISNGTGGMVFENVISREITDEEIRRFDHIYNGLDWGYYPDPWAFNRMHYSAAQRTIYIFAEGHALKTLNDATADMVKKKGVKPDELITADSEDPKSIADYRAYGLYCVGARKGPGSVAYGMKRLAGLKAIVIDPIRCPYTYQEFISYEYERTPEGDIMSGYPDRNNHHIDAVRYAMEAEFKWMGQ